MVQIAQRRVSRWMMPACLLSALAIGLLALAGCGEAKKPAIQMPRYVKLPAKQVPPFMKDTVFEYTDLGNTESWPISGFGLVTGLLGTGGNDYTPQLIRTYMIEEMVRHAFDQARVDESYKRMKPEEMLASNTTSIVTVVGYLPPGARKGQRIDVYVQALKDSNTTSLARGILYRLDLFNGLPDPFNPRKVNPYGAAEGNLFVNPAYALGLSASTQPSGMSSLRSGTVMDGGVCKVDRPLMLRLRQPEHRLARSIEGRVNLTFPKQRDDMATAQAQDEGMVYLYVPHNFNGDWEHFRQLVQHLYMDGGRAEFAAQQAKTLADEAIKPNAMLGDITYCWEGLGETALPFIQPLYANKSPDVAFAAARAGAFIGDPSAAAALVDMARVDGHPFQLASVKVLGALPATPRVQQMLDALLDSDQTLVRTEAYQILARQGYPRIQTQVLARPLDGSQPFVLDLVSSSGKPMIYATRVGIPRIVIFGRNVALQPPVMFSAFNYNLTISSNDQDQRLLNLYYRGQDARQPISMQSRRDVAELIWRLGGGTADGFRFSYAEVIGILQALSDRQALPIPVVLQELPKVEDWLDSAPAIPERKTRPQADEPGQAGAGITAAAPAATQPGH